MFQQKLDRSNHIIVNIWTSEDNKTIPGANVGHVSLQTQDTYMSLWPGKFTPKDHRLNSLEKVYVRYFGEREVSFKSSYLEDSYLEGLSEGDGHCRVIQNINECVNGEVACLFNEANGSITHLNQQPDKKANQHLLAIKPIFANVRIVLYSLRKDIIENSFGTRMNNTRGWRLIGSNLISRIADDSPESCSSLAYRLLNDGGMFNRLSGHNSSDTSSVVSPDDLVKYVAIYKEEEIKKYPETKPWFKIDCPDESSSSELVKKLNENNTPSILSRVFGKST